MPPNQSQQEIPIQPVDNPIICNPYKEPSEHWVYDTVTGEASPFPGRRPASYWYKTTKSAPGQGVLFAEEQRDELPLVANQHCRADPVPVVGNPKATDR